MNESIQWNRAQRLAACAMSSLAQARVGRRVIVVVVVVVELAAAERRYKLAELSTGPPPPPRRFPLRANAIVGQSPDAANTRAHCALCTSAARQMAAHTGQHQQATTRANCARDGQIRCCCRRCCCPLRCSLVGAQISARARERKNPQEQTN